MNYVKIIGSMIIGKVEITKQDLIDVKQGYADALINLVEGTYYDADENDWKKIEVVS